MIALDLPAPLATLIATLARAGGRPLIVGGAVRDAGFGLAPKDFDVEVYGLGGDAVVEALSAIGKVNAVGKSFGVFKVALAGLELDVTLPRRESKAGRGHKGFVVAPDPTMTPREAAARRDFTINALAYDPASGAVLDYFAGLADLETRTLRHTSPAFAEDPLRVLRGVQFAGRFNLRAAPETVELARRLLDEQSSLAPERIWGEWSKWALKSAVPSAGLVFLKQAGWRALHPELEALDGCPQDPEWHPEGDVWTHTLLVCDEAAAIATRDGLAADARLVLVLAALAHDLGKPETTVVERGRVRSPGHAGVLGVGRRLLARLGAPAKIVERVAALSKHHLTHLDFVGSRRHVRRLARGLAEGGESIELLARLIEADQNGRPPLPRGLPRSMVALRDLARELSAAEAAPAPLLLGRHLLELGFRAGPELGEILDAAYEAQLDGAFSDLEGARAWVLARRSPPA